MSELTFPPAVQAMFDNPAYWESNRAHRALSDDLDKRFRSALAGAVECTPHLTARFLDATGPFAHLPWLAWDDDPNGGYWIGFGIAHTWPNTDAATWPTFLWAQYLRETEDGSDWARDERAPGGLDHVVIRDPRTLAEHTVSMVKMHRESL